MVFGIENYLPEVFRNIQYNPFLPNLKYAFYSILFLIFLYLMRPKPNDKTVPSIMFFMKEGGKSKQNAFLQRFFNNLLFFLQLLAIILLCFALLEPFTMVKKDIVAENTVFVFDLSASISDSALQKGIEIAKSNMNGEISIVLVAETPLVALEKVSSQQALKILKNLETKPFGSAIGESIRIASEILGEEDGRIIVLSDFLNNIGPKPKMEKEKVEAKGQIIDFINIANPRSNIGIINVKIQEPSSILYIKNFNFEPQTVDVKINGNIQKVEIERRSIKTVPFELKSGINEVELLLTDDVKFDNKLILSTPLVNEIPILLITAEKDVFLESALKAQKDIRLDIAEPPVIPEVNYKVIIIDKFATEKILPGTVKDIEKNVKKGNSVVIMAFEGMQNLDSLMPVNYGQRFYDRKQINIDQDIDMTRDILFGMSESYFNVSPKSGFITIADVTGVPALGFSQLDQGYLFYYGIDENDQFKLSPSYPIFWSELIQFLLKAKELDYYNKHTGSILSLIEGEEIKTPSGETFQNHIILDTVGIYRIGEDEIAANFLNEEESDIFRDIEKGDQIGTQLANIDGRLVPQNLVIYSLLAIFLLLIIELIYIKYRGDI